MKRWAIITVFLYMLILLALTVPVALLAFHKWSWVKHNENLSLSEALDIYQEWAYWIWLGVMGLGQALLLLAPVSIAQRRLPARRPLLIPTITTAFLLANLFLWGIISIGCAIFNEGVFEIFGFLGNAVFDEGLYTAVSKKIFGFTLIPSSGDVEYIFGVIAAIAFLWLVWAILFYFFAKTDNPDALIKRATKWLLRGSILELLVAVPSHIIVRQRDTCCAPFGTFWGITTGLSVMLLCFGPGVFFLFAERFSKLQPKPGPQPALENVTTK